MHKYNYVITSEKDYLTLNNKNDNVVLFIDQYMTGKLHNFLSDYIKNNNVELYIKNIGNNSENNIYEERQNILNKSSDDILTLDHYRRYDFADNTFNSYVDLNVAIISDEIQFVTFDNTANLMYVNDNTIDDILTREVDVLLFITTWQGIFKEYTNMIAPERIEKYAEFIEKFKNKNIPVVFYSKEDPPNFNGFKTLSTYADFIYTSSLDKVNEYRKINKTAVIKNMTYGINPIHQSPIIPKNNAEEYMFAGTWFNGKYIDRMNATKLIFEYMDQTNKKFTFYNRNYYRDVELFNLPNKYKKFEMPALPYSDLLEVYKKFNYHINLNSVIDDPTMFAVRVLELQGLGKKIISNYSLPIYVDYPNITIFDKEIKAEFDIEEKILGIRNTFTNNAVSNFWSTIIDELRLNVVNVIPDVEYFNVSSKIMKKDIDNAFKYSNATIVCLTNDEDKYYTVSSIKFDDSTVVAQLSSNNVERFVYLPNSKYYTFKKKLISVTLKNYKYLSNINNEEYIVHLSEEIRNSKYIISQIEGLGFELLTNYNVRNKINIKQNMDALALITLLNYVGQIELFEFIDSTPISVGMIDADSSTIRIFINNYKKSIQKRTYLSFDLKQLTYKISDYN